MKKLGIITAAMAMALASGGYQNHNSGGNDFDATEWLRRNRERIDRGKVRKQMLPKKGKQKRFKVTYSKGNPPEFH
jgi:hypothetical protein